MKKSLYLAFGMLILASGFQFGGAQEKAATRTLKVKLKYSGSGTVDEKHKILVFAFDSPEFTQGSVMPFAVQGATSKEETVRFSEIGKSPVYIAAVYDPSGAYDGQSPPPSGSSVGMYTKAPPTPAPVNIDEGKTAEIDLPFDDSTKMP
jgi:hypothetical protein